MARARWEQDRAHPPSPPLPAWLSKRHPTTQIASAHADCLRDAIRGNAHVSPMMATADSSSFPRPPDGAG